MTAEIPLLIQQQIVPIPDTVNNLQQLLNYLVKTNLTREGIRLLHDRTEYVSGRKNTQIGQRSRDDILNLATEIIYQYTPWIDLGVLEALRGYNLERFYALLRLYEDETKVIGTEGEGQDRYIREIPYASIEAILGTMQYGFETMAGRPRIRQNKKSDVPVHAAPGRLQKFGSSISSTFKKIPFEKVGNLGSGIKSTFKKLPFEKVGNFGVYDSKASAEEAGSAGIVLTSLLITLGAATAAGVVSNTSKMLKVENAKMTNNAEGEEVEVLSQEQIASNSKHISKLRTINIVLFVLAFASLGLAFYNLYKLYKPHFYKLNKPVKSLKKAIQQTTQGVSQQSRMDEARRSEAIRAANERERNVLRNYSLGVVERDIDESQLLRDVGSRQKNQPSSSSSGRKSKSSLVASLENAARGSTSVRR